LPLTETGAGVILASIKEGLGHGENGAQKALSPIEPRKRRHIERHEQENPAGADSLSLYQENRGKEKLNIYNEALLIIYQQK
jgi:hypothetical protein